MNEKADPPGIDRRTVLKAGVWTAPAIVLATSTPAFAVVSGEQGEIRFTNVTAWIEGTALDFQGIAGTTQFQATWSATAQVVTSATLTITVPSAGMLVENPTVTVGGSQWTAAGASALGDDIVYTFLWAGSIDPEAPGISDELEFLLPGTGTVLDASFPKTITAVLTSPQATGDAGSGTLAATNIGRALLAVIVLDPFVGAPP
jgi:hypothetical protein